MEPVAQGQRAGRLGRTGPRGPQIAPALGADVLVAYGSVVVVVVVVPPVSSGKPGTQSSVVVVVVPDPDGSISAVDGVVVVVRVVVVVVVVVLGDVVDASTVSGTGWRPGSIELREVCTTANTRTTSTTITPAPAA